MKLLSLSHEHTNISEQQSINESSIQLMLVNTIIMHMVKKQNLLEQTNKTTTTTTTAHTDTHTHRQFEWSLKQRKNWNEAHSLRNGNRTILKRKRNAKFVSICTNSKNKNTLQISGYQDVCFDDDWIQNTHEMLLAVQILHRLETMVMKLRAQFVLLLKENQTDANKWISKQILHYKWN